MTTKRRRVQFTPSQPSRTKQSFKEECNVNSILDRYRRTGQLTHVRVSLGQYGDFTQFNDYQEAINLVLDAQQQFDQLPAHLRERFGNSPEHLIRFVADPNNYQEALKLGILSSEAVAKHKLQNDDLTTNKSNASNTQPNQKKDATKED